MKREVYIWIGLIIVVVAASLYFRFFYQPLISVALGISPATHAQIYPYQKAQFSIEVFNNGTSPITNMSLGILINGNLSTLYKVTVPAGKRTTIPYNYSPTATGSYVISVVADPGMLYNIADRSHSQAYASLSVLAPENATPSVLLGRSNMTSFKHAALTNGAYLLGSYMYDQFNVSLFTLTGDSQIDAFLKPIFNLTSYYIKNMSVADATYSSNDSSEYSIWVKGYLSPSIFAAATLGSSLSTVNVSTRDGQVTFIKMLNDTTLCGWYSGGWLKVLAEKNTIPCYSMINASETNSSPVQPSGLGTVFGKRLAVANSTLLANYSRTSASGDYLAKLSLVNNASFVYTSIANNSTGSLTCFGVIGSVNGTSYCSTYILPKSGEIGSFALIRTTAYKGGYNLTAFSLVNTSVVLSQVSNAEGILQNLSVNGTSLAFTSGVSNTCEFNNSFSCGNVTYSNGTVSFSIKNELNTTAVLNNIRCYVGAGIISTALNDTLPSGASTNVTTACYEVSTPLSGQQGVQLNLDLSLALNYTSSNSTNIVAGSAYIPLG